MDSISIKMFPHKIRNNSKYSNSEIHVKIHINRIYIFGISKSVEFHVQIKMSFKAIFKTRRLYLWIYEFSSATFFFFCCFSFERMLNWTVFGNNMFRSIKKTPWSNQQISKPFHRTKLRCMWWDLIIFISSSSTLNLIWELNA